MASGAGRDDLSDRAATRPWAFAAAVLLAGAATAAGLILLAGAAGLWFEDLLPRIAGFAGSVERLARAIRAWGAAAPFASMALMVLHNFVPFPAELLAVANGMVFGLVLGTAVTWAGAMLGALVAFGLARRLGRPAVRRIVGERRAAAVDAWAARGGVSGLLVVRLVPVISFNLVNYAAGLAGIGWWTFTWTTALGILPVTAASVAVGSHMTRAPWQLWALLGGAVVLLAAARWAWRRRA